MALSYIFPTTRQPIITRRISKAALLGQLLKWKSLYSLRIPCASHQRRTITPPSILDSHLLFEPRNEPLLLTRFTGTSRFEHANWSSRIYTKEVFLCISRVRHSFRNLSSISAIRCLRPPSQPEQRLSLLQSYAPQHRRTFKIRVTRQRYGL